MAAGGWGVSREDMRKGDRINSVPKLSSDASLTREMSITHKEFFRLLPKAVESAPVSHRDDAVVITTRTGRVRVTLAPETTRKLAMLEFPVTEITLEFTGFTAAARQAFLARFNLAFQKGGG